MSQLDTVGLIFLILEGILVVTIAFLAFKKKTIVSKSVAWYFFPVFLLLLSIYSYGCIVNLGGSDAYDFFVFSDCVVKSLKAFAFEANKGLVLSALKSDLYSYSFYIIHVIAAYTLISSAVSLIKNSCLNFLRSVYRTLKGGDVVFGYNDDSLTYVKKNKNTILWIDSTYFKLSKEEKNNLYKNKTAFYYKKFSFSALQSYLRMVRGTIHFIFFKNQKTYQHYSNYIDIFTGVKIKPHHKVFLHLETKNEYLDFVNDQISSKINKSNSRIVASTFNVHELVARKFAQENTLIDGLIPGSIDNCALKKDINVVFIGFGKINYSIFKSCLINNQFVEIRDDKFVAKPVNYYLYDKDSSVFNKELIMSLESDYNKDKKGYFPAMEKICNLKYKEIDIKNITFVKELRSIIKDNGNNILFISFSDGLENAAFSSFLMSELKDIEENFSLFYNIDNKLEVINHAFNKRVKTYGFRDDVLCHDIVANDKLAILSMKVNDIYHDMLNDEEKLIHWERLPIVEKISNTYNVLNTDFKLKMLGYSLKSLKQNENIIPEINKKYFETVNIENINILKSFKDYAYYFTLTTRNALANIEHLRWNAVYFISGFRPMKINEIVLSDNKIVSKNIENKVHSCLTTFFGLDEVNEKIVDVYKKHNITKDIQNIEKFKYDYMILDNIETFINIINNKNN